MWEEGKGTGICSLRSAFPLYLALNRAASPALEGEGVAMGLALAATLGL